MLEHYPNKQNFTKLVPLYAWILIFILALFPTPNIWISNNSAFYLIDAANVLQGESFGFLKDGNVFRGPLYQFFLAPLLFFSEYDVVSIFIAQKILLGLMLWLLFIYGIGKNQSIGFLTIFAVLVNYNALTIFFMIDSVGLYSLVCCGLLYCGFHCMLVKTNFTHGMLLALLISLCLGIKETALLYLPFVAFIIIQRFDLKSFLGFVFIFGFCETIRLSYIYQISGQFLPYLGHFNPIFMYEEILARAINGSLISISREGLFVKLFEFVSVMLLSKYWAYVTLSGVLVCFGYMRSQHKERGILLIATLLFLIGSFALPVLDFSIGGKDPRQSFPFILSLLFTSYFWWHGWYALRR